MSKNVILSTFSNPELSQISRSDLFFLAPTYQLEGDKNISAGLGLSEPIENTVDNINKMHDLYVNDYERLLSSFSCLLNKFHNKNNQIKYWESIVGSWFFRFLQTIHNRKRHLERVIERFNLEDLNILVPKNIDQILGVLTENQIVKNLNDPYWNACLYQLICEVYKIDIKKINIDKSAKYENASKKVDWAGLYSKLATKINSGKIIFYKPYVPKNSLLNFVINTRSLPVYGLRVPEKFNVECDLEKRINALQSTPFLSIDDKLFLEVLIRLAPTIFFEDFLVFRDKALKYFSDINPEIIYTANGFAGDFYFQVWAAEKQKSGSIYVVGQHGNNYGTLEISKYFPETRVPDYFLTWGWKMSEYKTKCVPFGDLVNRQLVPNQKSKKIKNVLILPKGQGNPGSFHDRFVEYRNELDIACRIANWIEKEFSISVLIKPHNNISEGQKDELKKRFLTNKKIEIANNSKSTSDLISSSDLVVFTYDSTGILECARAQTMFMAIFEYCESAYFKNAKNIYDRLFDVGVFNRCFEAFKKNVFLLDTQVISKFLNFFFKAKIRLIPKNPVPPTIKIFFFKLKIF